MSEVNEVIPADMSEVGFKDVRIQLEEIANENRSLAFDYKSTSGQVAAKKQIHRLRKLNGAIDKTHKQIKADVLRQTKLIDSAKRELKATVAEMIEIHKAPLDEIAAEEEARVQAIQDKITRLEGYLSYQAGPTENSMAIIEYGLELKAIEITPEDYQERMAEATNLRLAGLKQIRTEYLRVEAEEKHAAEIAELKAKQAEEEAKREEERRQQEAELAELRAKQAEQDRIANEKRIAEEAKAEAERVAAEKAEVAKQQAEREREELIRKEQAAIEAKKVAEQAVIDAAKAQEKRAEQAKKDAVEAERKRVKAAAAKQAREEAKRQADLDHTESVMDDAAADIAKADVGVSPATAYMVLGLIRDGKVRGVSIKF